MELDLYKVIEADEETLPNTEKDWEEPEQIEVHKNMESDLPFLMQTGQNRREKTAKKFNSYGYDFVVDSIRLKRIANNLMDLDKVTA